MQKVNAFTLAEVLITLAIIGVIAAITVPVLHANYTEQERISRVKKVYSVFANAMTFVKADGGDYVLESGNNIDSMKEWFDTYLAPRLVTTKVCYSTSGCWNDKYIKKPNGDKFTSLGSNDSHGLGAYNISAVMNDGTLINIDDYSYTQITNILGVDSSESGMGIIFDINGVKEPNTLGKDVFVLVYTHELGVVPAYKDRTVAEITTDCSKTGSGISCINKYLKQ